jgi:hypothetical protein
MESMIGSVVLKEIKSIDIPSSPDADVGKTKDTSAYSGNKLLTRVSGNKTYLSMNKDNSLINGSYIQPKLMALAESCCK